jgi:type IV pilus assembly protein PilA
MDYFKNHDTQKGFTLVELMIVVAIIGVLVMLAAPNFQMHTRKVHQSEAKLALSAMYTLEKSFYSEYSAYAPALDAIGYSPEGRARFYAHLACFNGPWVGTITGYSGPHAVYQYLETGSPVSRPWNPNPVETCNLGDPGHCALITATDPQTFINSASGSLCTACYTDIWQIDQFKQINHCSDGIK